RDNIKVCKQFRQANSHWFAQHWIFIFLVEMFQSEKKLIITPFLQCQQVDVLWQISGETLEFGLVAFGVLAGELTKANQWFHKELLSQLSVLSSGLLDRRQQNQMTTSNDQTFAISSWFVQRFTNTIAIIEKQSSMDHQFQCSILQTGTTLRPVIEYGQLEL